MRLSEAEQNEILILGRFRDQRRSHQIFMICLIRLIQREILLSIHLVKVMDYLSTSTMQLLWTIQGKVSELNEDDPVRRMQFCAMMANITRPMVTKILETFYFTKPLLAKIDLEST